MKNDKLNHPCFPQPEDNSVKVWRYLELEKFLDIVTKEKLYLSRVDKLGDLHEGSITRKSYISRLFEFQKNEMIDSMDIVSKINENWKKAIFVSCWYMNNFESQAMWKLYCPDNKGIAIQTSYKKLFESFDYEPSINLGKINYIDYEKEWFPDGNSYYPIMHKRKAFEHEKEIRIVKTIHEYVSFENIDTPFGIYLTWDFKNTIENIYVNPYAENWYYDLIRSIFYKLEINLPISWSSMKEGPYY